MRFNFNTKKKLFFLFVALSSFILSSFVFFQKKKQLDVHTIIEAIDSKDPSVFSEIITEDAIFKFGNAPQSVGKEAIFKAQKDFFSTIKDLKHKVINSWRDNNNIVAQMEVTYTRKDGSKITLPVVDVFNIKSNKVHKILVYMDITPLYVQK